MRDLLAPILIIGFIHFLFFARLFYPEPMIFYLPEYERSDIWNQNYPFKDFLSHSLKHGELPFWSKDAGTGFSLFAEGQVGTLYIPNLILFYFLPTWIAWNLSYILLFLLSFLGAYLFYRELGILK
jgi:hypothetical protein